MVCIAVAFGLGRLQENFRARGDVDPITRIARFTFTAPGALLNAAFQQSNLFIGHVWSVNRLILENERLKGQIKELQPSEQLKADRDQELKNNRALLGLPDYGRTKVPAHVIGYLPGENRMRLSVGKRDGVSAGMPVIGALGLVGQVSTVENTSCDVTLIVSPNLRVSAVMESTNRFAGILRGETPSSLVMDLIDSSVNPRAGDEVVTSGMSEAYPRGIVIGDVKEVKTSRDFGYSKVYVSPRIVFDDVTETFVLK